MLELEERGSIIVQDPPGEGSPLVRRSARLRSRSASVTRESPASSSKSSPAQRTRSVSSAKRKTASRTARRGAAHDNDNELQLSQSSQQQEEEPDVLAASVFDEQPAESKRATARKTANRRGGRRGSVSSAADNNNAAAAQRQQQEPIAELDEETKKTLSLPTASIREMLRQQGAARKSKSIDELLAMPIPPRPAAPQQQEGEDEDDDAPPEDISTAALKEQSEAQRQAEKEARARAAAEARERRRRMAPPRQPKQQVKAEQQAPAAPVTNPDGTLPEDFLEQLAASAPVAQKEKGKKRKQPEPPEEDEEEALAAAATDGEFNFIGEGEDDEDLLEADEELRAALKGFKGFGKQQQNRRVALDEDEEEGEMDLFGEDLAMDLEGADEGERPAKKARVIPGVGIEKDGFILAIDPTASDPAKARLSATVTHALGASTAAASSSSSPSASSSTAAALEFARAALFGNRHQRAPVDRVYIPKKARGPSAFFTGRNPNASTLKEDLLPRRKRPKQKQPAELPPPRKVAVPRGGLPVKI